MQAVGVGPETIDSGVDVAGPTTTAPSVGPTTVGGSRPMRPPVARPRSPQPHHGQAGAKPDLAVGSNPPAAERSAHHRPDDHQTEAIDHDDIIDHHHHDHDRPVNERSALTTGCLGGSNLSGQLTLKRRRVPGGCGT